MGWQLSIYAVVALASGLVTAWLASVGWRRRDRTGATAFTIMMVGISWWCFRDAIRFGVSTEESYRLATYLGFPGHVIALTAGVVFVLQHVGLDRWITRRTVAALAIQPAITIGLWLTMDRHSLLWWYTADVETDPITTMPTAWGPWWEIHLAYNYVLVAVVLGLLGWFIARSRGPYRLQTTVMLVGALVPGAVNALWLAGVSPVPNVEVTSLAFAVTGALYAVGLFSFDLLDLAPVARHTVVEEAHDGVVTVGRDDRIVDANPVARRLLEDDSLVGRMAAEVVPRYEDVLAGEDVEDVSIEVDGEPRYFDVRVSPLTDAAGTVVGKVLVLRDVTERRRVEKRYQLLTENSSDIIHVVDPHGDVRYVSPSVRRVLGFDPHNQEGKNALDFVHPDDREVVGDRLQEILDRPGEELQVEYRTKHADGSYAVLESRGRNLLDDPVVEGIVINSRDVSERKRREQRLRHQNRQLEEFANVISHDLRSPLTVARGYADLLAGEFDDGKLDRVQEAHRRMDELLEDLLELARDGRVVDDPEPIDLTTAVKEAWSTVNTDAASLTIDPVDEVLADPSRLRELLENLFCNAVEHGSTSPQHTGDAVEHGSTSPRSQAREDAVEHGSTSPQHTEDVVAVEVGPLEEGNGFYVQDDGPGIPEDERERIFEPGISTAEDGTGFGLAIVKEIVDAHGWRVSVTDADRRVARADGAMPRAGDGASDPDWSGARFEFTDVVSPD